MMADMMQTPPIPPASERRSLMTYQGEGAPGLPSRSFPSQSGGGPGLGALAGNKNITVMQGMQMTKNGLGLIASSLPALSGALTALIQQLEQTIPQALADMASGTGLPAVGGLGPGAAPVAPPPSPMPAGVGP